MPYGGSFERGSGSKQRIPTANDGRDRTHQRYFIVTHGRSGSSFLAAILDFVGADFGSASFHGGDTDKQHWESRKIERAIRCAELANQNYAPAMSGLKRAGYRFWRSRAKALLRSGLHDAVYSKNRWNTSVLPLAEKLGYQPIPIVSYRHPAEIALSDMTQLKNTPSALFPTITRTFVDALYALERYGGVVIDHSELVNPAEEKWAHALGEVTGFPPRALLDARKLILKPKPPREDSGVWLPSELRAVAQNLSSMRNIALPAPRRGIDRPVYLRPVSF
ncbi:MAG TPA: hypothetical protein VG942_09005 [Hyphomonadaceae bacterium]|nr:hypothetical protein [Hyphomonadaceae bacterium]